MTRSEMDALKWREIDILLVTGDGYFDHPSHGAAVIGRVLAARGYRVGIAARPNWRSLDDFRRLGRPSLFAGVTSGAVDSTVNNYTAALSRRRNDVYAPGGAGMGRPNQAVVVYANRLKEAFPGLPIVLGGIEASTRRFAYWDPIKERVRRSVLVDSRADILVHGPGELAVVEIAARIGTKEPLTGIAGTARLVSRSEYVPLPDDVVLPPFEEVQRDPGGLVEQVVRSEAGGCPGARFRMLQNYREGIVLCEPRGEFCSQDLDRVHALGFANQAHPLYRDPIPALETVRWSVISHRGCPGGCSFCALAFHQGRQVVSRSRQSVVDEIDRLRRTDGFKGSISDVGGPTANAFGTVLTNLEKCAKCKRKSCLHPKRCSHLATDHTSLLALLDHISHIPGIKNVRLASGIRHDLALEDPLFIREVAKKYTGGQLKLAPEHVAPSVLKRMRKPPIEKFEQFERAFLEASAKAGKEQFIIPYFIAGFPGCRPGHADQVGAWLKKRGQSLRQVQVHMPLPGTIAAAWHASQTDGKGRPLYVPPRAERTRQKNILLGNP